MSISEARPLRWATKSVLAGMIAALALLTGASQADTLTGPSLSDSGAGSLRDAIQSASPDDTIVFNSGLSGTILLTSGELFITNALTITGPGANTLAVSGNFSSRVFHVNGSETVNISGLTIKNGSITNLGGGIYLEFGTTLTVNNCTITGNSSQSDGGGAYEGYGTLTFNNCMISGNTASGSGGGIFHGSGSLLVMGSTVSGNNAMWGGGLSFGAYDSCINSTFAGNHASVIGGAMYGFSATAGITNCTIDGNTANSSPGGIFLGSGTATVRNCIIAGNSDTSGNDDCSGVFTSAGFNLIGNGTGSSGWTGVGDQVGTAGSLINPLLSPLQDNGGPTLTMIPLAGSHAIDLGNSSGITTDQRGLPRPFINNASLTVPTGGDHSEIGSVELSLLPSGIVFNTNDSGGGSLRLVIAQAATNATITFASNVTGTIVLTSGELLIPNSMNILGPGAKVLAVSGNNSSRVFDITNGSVLLSGLTITNGRISSSFVNGGGIFSSNKTSLTLSNCAVLGNFCAGSGGGIANSGSLTGWNLTIAFNQAAGGGGAVFNASASATALLNCTIFSNKVTASLGGVGGGVENNGLLSVTNCTICQNLTTNSFGDGGGIYSISSTNFISSSIIANNTSANGPDMEGTFRSQGYNLVGKTNGSSGFTNGIQNDQVGSISAPLNPLLGPLQDNGGPTATLALLPGSPAIDAGGVPVLTTDQRGRARPSGSAGDIGAFEFSPPFTFIVINRNDSGPGSLRQAISDAAPGDTITFDPSVAGAINLTSGGLPTMKPLSIIGPGAKVLTINGDFSHSIFQFGGSPTLLSGLTISGGGSPAITNSANLTMSNCTLTANSGVALWHGSGSLALTGCSFIQNSGSGLAIGAGTTASAINCTFFDNQDFSGSGGGITNLGALTLRGCTIAGNHAGVSAGGIYNAGTVDIGDTIVAQNQAGASAPSGQDVSGSFNSSGYNLIGENDGSSGFTDGVSADQVGSSGSPRDPKFGFAIDTSGPTPAVRLQLNSPAIDAGNSFGSTTDQRGRVRPFDDPAIPNAPGGDGSDIGAVESGAPPICADCSIQVNVDASRALRAADGRWLGINAGAWDGQFDSPATVSALAEAGCRVLRYPGGSLADQYHWQTDLTEGDASPWVNSFDHFVHTATNLGAQVFITVNYGTGTADEAADWVIDANVDNQYGFKYWEVGNECYFLNETDNNTNAPNMPHDPWTYATRFADYYTEMKDFDPTIKVGMVSIPGEDSANFYTTHPAVNPRTGLTHYGWTPVVLSTLKSLGIAPDFMVHHFYPEIGVDDDAYLLQASYNWTGDAAELRQEISDYFGSGGTNIELVCTENNSDSGPVGRQSTSLVNALYLADSMSQLMKTEFNSYVWWDLRNSTDTGGDFDPSIYGWRSYGDFGLINNGNRHPTFYAMKLMQYFAQPGDTILNVSTANPLLSTYAARQASGSLSLLVINKDPVNTISNQINLLGLVPDTTMTVRSYGIPQDEATQTNGPAAAQDIATNSVPLSASFSYPFPPYSLTLFTFSPAKPSLAVQPAPTGNAFVFQLQGQSGVRYVIESSTNLTQWAPIQTNTFTGGTMNVTNLVTPGMPEQFWRAVWMP